MIITNELQYGFIKWPEICEKCAAEEYNPCGHGGYCLGIPDKVIARLISRDLPIGKIEIDKMLTKTLHFKSASELIGGIINEQNF